MNDGLEPRNVPPGYEHVPTMPELERRGLARQIKTTHYDRAGRAKSETRYLATAEGQALINEAMQRNADRGREFDAQRRADREAARAA